MKHMTPAERREFLKKKQHMEEMADFVAVAVKDIEAKQDEAGTSYRKVYEKARKAYDDGDEGSEVPEDYMTAAQCYLDYVNERVESKIKSRSKTLAKFRELKAPAIIIENEIRLLGYLEGEHDAIRKLIKMSAAYEAIKNINCQEGFKWEVLQTLDHETCFRCAYMVDEGDEDSCLLNSAYRNILNLDCCPHFKLEKEPFWETRRKCSGSMEERISQAVEITNNVKRRDWEAEGKPDFSDEEIETVEAKEDENESKNDN